MLVLKHNSWQMVFLVVRFLTASLFDGCRSYSNTLGKRNLSLGVHKLSAADPEIKPRSPTPITSISHLDLICGLKIEGHRLIRITDTQPFQRLRGRLYGSNQAPCPLWNVNKHTVY